jgi:hypothetical protein
MVMRAWVIAVCLPLVSAEMLLCAEPPPSKEVAETRLTKQTLASGLAEQGTELTAEAGLVIKVQNEKPDDSELILKPTNPYIWCWVIEEPIPLYFDYPRLQIATIGEFELHLGEHFRWEEFTNSAHLNELEPARSMLGVQLGLANETPAILGLASMMKKSQFERLKDWCQNGPGNLAWITFAVSLDDGNGGKFFDPGVGVKRGG